MRMNLLLAHSYLETISAKKLVEGLNKVYVTDQKEAGIEQKIKEQPKKNFWGWLATASVRG